MVNKKLCSVGSFINPHPDENFQKLLFKKKINFMRKIFFSIIFFLAVFAFSEAQDAVPSFVKDSLDNYVNRALTEWQIPGVAVCVVKDGNVVVMKGYGVKDYDTKEKVDENTLFMIGSNTKAFTATALAILDAEKKLSLDDKVTKWIPEFKLENQAAGEQAIIRDLLCHRIGFRTFQGDFTYWTSNLTRKEVIEKMSHIKATYPFRTTWGYTNASFLTAGEIIPKAVGMQWEEFIKTRIFDPLGMKNSLALSKDFPNAANKCSPYTKAEGKLVKIPFCYIDNLAPAGSIGSSVNDMSHWVMMQLNGGKYEGTQVVPLSALNATYVPHSILGNGGQRFNTGHFSLYGLGWFLQEYCGKKIVSHTGGVNGFVTSVTLIPEEKLGVIVFTNTDQNAFYEALKWEIMDAYLKMPYRNYSKDFLGRYLNNVNAELKHDQSMKDSVALHLKTELAQDAYTGNYFNDVYGDMKVVVEKGELRMKFLHHPDMYAKLESLGGNRFYATFSDPEFSKAIFPFAVENGKVKSVTVKVADFVEYNPYLFVKK
jgi:CubicO group peptidase (beta-lactamase class C family)